MSARCQKLWLRRMRLPLVSASLAMTVMLLMDLSLPPPVPPPTKQSVQRDVTGWEFKAEEEGEGAKEEGEEETLLFSQTAWDNVQEGEDWDSIFDTDAWSSLLNEGFVGANVKDEPPLPRFKKPTRSVGAAPIVKFKPPMVQKVEPPPKVVISLGLTARPPAELLVVSNKKKGKKSKVESLADRPPEVIQPLPPPSGDKPDNSWYDAAYARSPTHGRAKEFVEDEALFPSCAASIVAARAWSQTFLPLGPFRYLGRSKNPCWYPDDGSKFTCYPYFVLAGVAGPGTDDVMRKLLIHPDVIGKTEKQFWWDVGRHAGKTWDEYREQFQRQAEDILLDINDHKVSNKIIGDSSATYFSSPTGWERLSGNENCVEPRITLASHLRRLRLKGFVIVVLPHPTRRLLAEFHQQSTTTKVGLTQFHEHVQHAINAYKNCFAEFSLRRCAYNVTLANSVKVSLHEGMYSVYMEDWVRIFPPEQLKVIRYEDYVTNTVPTLEAIFDFLGIPQIEPAELAIVTDPRQREFREVVSSHNPGHVLPQTVHLLNNFYQPFLSTLSSIMADPVKFSWKDT